MRNPGTAREQDLRTLVGIVTDERADVAAEGLPLSLLSELADLIRCDQIALFGMDSNRQQLPFIQEVPIIPGVEALQEGYWELHRTCEGCNYPERTGDLRSVIKVTDFYSTPQWHGTGMYTDYSRPLEIEHDLMLTLPARTGPALDPRKSVRLLFVRGPGPDFTER